MYKRKIPIDPHCGIGIAMEVIISKWKYCILAQIENGVTRPKDMVEAVPGLTKRVLHQQMKQLEYYRIVGKTTYAEVPLRVEYWLTEAGKEVLPLLQQLEDWGLGYIPQIKEIMESDESSDISNVSSHSSCVPKYTSHPRPAPLCDR